MLRQIEVLSGRRVSFQRRYRKLRRREQRLTRAPLPGPVTPQPIRAERPQRDTVITSKKLFSPTLLLSRKSLEEVH
jgi:hypothetical protein